MLHPFLKNMVTRTKHNILSGVIGMLWSHHITNRFLDLSYNMHAGKNKLSFVKKVTVTFISPL